MNSEVAETTVNLQMVESIVQLIRSLPQPERQVLNQRLGEETETSISQVASIKAIEPTTTTGQSLLNMMQQFIEDIPEEEINQFPTDAAQQHDHYLYGTPKC
jgi:hypothetical protein